MKHEVRVPDSHFTQGDSFVADVVVRPGDFVLEQLDTLVVVETPTVMLNIQSNVNGAVVQLNATPKKPVKIGDLLAVIDTSVQLSGIHLERWIAEFGCPICGSRLADRETDYGNNEPIREKRRTIETATCPTCHIRASRSRHAGTWERWRVAQV